jgi:hypothetical protein
VPWLPTAAGATAGAGASAGTGVPALAGVPTLAGSGAPSVAGSGVPVLPAGTGVPALPAGSGVPWLPLESGAAVAGGTVPSAAGVAGVAPGVGVVLGAVELLEPLPLRAGPLYVGAP